MEKKSPKLSPERTIRSPIKNISRQKQLLIVDGLLKNKKKNTFSPITKEEFMKSKKNLRNIKTDYMKEYNQAYKDELDIIERIDDCNIDISKNYSNIDYGKLNMLLKYQFFNHNLFEVNRCIINRILNSKYGYIHYINNIKVMKREDKEKEQNQIVSFVNFDNFESPSMTIKYDLNEYNLQFKYYYWESE
jgi:hypothetical protein